MDNLWSKNDSLKVLSWGLHKLLHKKKRLNSLDNLFTTKESTMTCSDFHAREKFPEQGTVWLHWADSWSLIVIKWLSLG